MCLAVPARIVSIQGEMAVVEIGGVARSISLALTPDAQMGQYVILRRLCPQRPRAGQAQGDPAPVRPHGGAGGRRARENSPRRRGTPVKYVDEFRDPGLAGGLLERIAQRSTRAVRLTGVLRQHAHAIYGTGCAGCCRPP